MPHSIKRLRNIKEDTSAIHFFLKGGGNYINYPMCLMDSGMGLTETELMAGKYFIFTDNGQNSFED